MRKVGMREVRICNAGNGREFYVLTIWNFSRGNVVGRVGFRCLWLVAGNDPCGLSCISYFTP